MQTKGKKYSRRGVATLGKINGRWISSLWKNMELRGISFTFGKIGKFSWNFMGLEEFKKKNSVFDNFALKLKNILLLYYICSC